MTEPVVEFLCDGYTREAGVRNLERKVAAICRACVMKLVEGGVDQSPQASPGYPQGASVTFADIRGILGPPPFVSLGRRFRPDDAPAPSPDAPPGRLGDHSPCCR